MVQGYDDIEIEMVVIKESNDRYCNDAQAYAICLDENYSKEVVVEQCSKLDEKVPIYLLFNKDDEVNDAVCELQKINEDFSKVSGFITALPVSIAKNEEDGNVLRAFNKIISTGFLWKNKKLFEQEEEEEEKDGRDR